MSQFYSILKISVNPKMDDTISIGLLMLAGDRYWFKFSREKLRYLRPFLGNNIQALEKTLNIITRKINSFEGFQLDLYSDLNTFFNESFLLELNDNQQGLIRFSTPKEILLTGVNAESFEGLFNSIIGKDETRRIVKRNREKEIIQQKLIKPLEGKVHTHFKLSANHLSDLYYRYELDAIGKAQSIYMAKHLDFAQTPSTLDMKIMRLLFINRLLTQVYRCKSRVFVIASEPPMVKKKRHQLYEFVARNEILEIRTPDECPQIVHFFLKEGMEEFIS